MEYTSGIFGFDVVYNPIDFTFRWTPPEDESNRFDVGWYEWDYEEAHRLAQKKRDEDWHRLKAQGHKVRRYSTKNQRMRRGGLGTGHPQIDLVVTVYGIRD